MEKEKILRELEKKLLPSVHNLEKEQATDHDFLPALLWMLLEKSKDSESSNQLVEQKMSTLADSLTSLSKSIKEERAKDIKEVADKVIQNNQENKKLYEELLSKAVNFMAEKNQESNKKIEQIKSWFLVSFMFHVITLVILAIILKR